MPDDQTTVAPTQDESGQDEPGQVKPDNENDKDKAEKDLAFADLQPMLEDEAKHLDELRKGLCSGSPGGRIGLALSGGGIRSATFSLGVVQALAEKRLIARLDYISTVSGGGYIGAWLSACIHRARNVRDVEASITRQIARLSPDEAPEVRFLRAYSNYLTPRLGLLSGDTLAAMAGLLRNLVLNLALGVLSVLFAVVVIHAAIAGVMAVYTFTPVEAEKLNGWAVLFLGLAFAAISFCLTFQSQDVRTVEGADRNKRIFDASSEQRSFARAAVVALCFGLSLGSISISLSPTSIGWLQMGLLILVVIGAMGVGSVFAHLSFDEYRLDKNSRWKQRSKHWHKQSWMQRCKHWWKRRWARVKRKGLGSRSELKRYGWAIAACTGATFVVLISGPSFIALAQPGARSAILVAAVGPVAGTIFLWFLLVLWTGVVSNHYSEFSREWLSRFLGGLTGWAGSWLLISVLVVHMRPIWRWSSVKASAFVAQKPFLTTLEGAAVIGLAFAAVWALSRLRVPRAEKAEAEAKRPVTMAVCWIVVIAFVCIVVVGFQEALFLLTLSAPPPTICVLPPDVAPVTYACILAEHLGKLKLALSAHPDLYGTLKITPALNPENWLDWTKLLQCCPIVFASLLVAGVTYLSFLCVDVNTFSLQNLYRNRLVRCYLGAAHGAGRLPNPYTGFDPQDEFELAKLANQRPYWLINAALNITQGQDLAWQQRKAAAFLLSPRWCGYWLQSTETSGIAGKSSTRGGYVETSRYVREEKGFRGGLSDGVLIGTAMATSGAAVSSQMGFASRGSLAFVLTLLNLRLGRWFPNSVQKGKVAARNATRELSSPKYGASWYLRELLGWTDERLEWVYVSDGGHFENLGIYELVRRRCPLIISVDAGADPKRTFADLGNAIQKCRVDLGVDIEIDVSDLQVDIAGFSNKAFRCGTIRYPATTTTPVKPAFEGRLLYLKPSLLRSAENLPGDILAYHARHPEFPHEATTNQWFSESQFESYRHLGYLIGQSALSAVAACADPHPRYEG